MDTEQTPKKKDGRSKPRGKYHYKKVELVKPAQTTVPDCEACGAWPAVYKWYAGRTLCDDCAAALFRAHIKAMLGGGALLLGAVVYLIS